MERFWFSNLRLFVEDISVLTESDRAMKEDTVGLSQRPLRSGGNGKTFNIHK